MPDPPTIVVLLSSDEHGDDPFHYEDLEAALDGIRRLFNEALRCHATDGIARRISLCVGEPQDVAVPPY